MKKSFIVILLMFISIMGDAQNNKDSLLLSFFKTPEVLISTNTAVNKNDIKLGYGIGVVFTKMKRTKIKRNIGVSYEWIDLQSNTTIAGHYSNINVSKSTLTTLSIPYYYDFYLHKKKSSIFCTSGVFGSFTNTILIEGHEYYSLISSTYHDYKKQFKGRLNTGLILGLGSSFSINDKEHIVIRAGIKYGLFNLLPAENSSGFFNKAYNVSIGYLF